MCGNGGCMYALFRGDDYKYLGWIGGNQVYVRDQRINEFAVLNTLWHLSAGSASYSTTVYDGHSYVTVSSVVIGGLIGSGS